MLLEGPHAGRAPGNARRTPGTDRDPILTDCGITHVSLEVLAGIHRRAVLAGKVFLVVAPDPRAREAMRVTGLDRTLLVFPTVADFRAWNGGCGTQPGGGGVLTCE